MRVLVGSVVILVAILISFIHAQSIYETKSGIAQWVDPDTPADKQTYQSSRGRPWTLVMSDEFNTPNRSFRPGDDHLWTSLEKADGVNSAIDFYSHNMTSTKCDYITDKTGKQREVCYFFIKVMDEHIQLTVYNLYARPPTFQTANLYYRAAMVQSWNKFCFQGGMLEVSAQLPGALSSKSGNPDLKLDASSRITDKAFYPTWPGIWMMGNLGRAIFGESTSRMWPFSYDRCAPDEFEPSNQRINACDEAPGYGLNPKQGRGAPEIDLLEGGGKAISSSIQIGPGMPTKFRVFDPVALNETGGKPVVDKSWKYCIYSRTCKTPGANSPGVPSALYAKRSYKSWYQGLRYSSNPYCRANATDIQSYATVSNAQGHILQNYCEQDTCSASADGYADLTLIDGKGAKHWGINNDGKCFPIMNSYRGSYLCDPDSQNPLCETPRNASTPKTNVMKPFEYQMDAVSANWDAHIGVYTSFVKYQIEWVTGKHGYIRWMLDGNPIFEITSDSLTNVQQDSAKSNPRKIMIEEPMYLIFNVALSSAWGALPVYTDRPCRGYGNETDKKPAEIATIKAVCDSYPMYMKIDYVRLYQDLGDGRDDDNLMQLGCDPATHPTKKWIQGHLKEYQDDDNPAIDVIGGAFCQQDEDCTVATAGNISLSKLVTGRCSNVSRCECTHPDAWGGPRCTVLVGSLTTYDGLNHSYGPPLEVGIVLGSVTILLTIITVWRARLKARALKTTKKRPEHADIGLSPVCMTDDALSKASSADFSAI